MKVFLQYVLMVGVSVLMVVGLLHLGRNLKAPVSVGGAWELDISQQVDAGACESALIWTEPPRLEISQSGPYISLNLNDTSNTKLEGIVEGTELSGGTTKTSASTPGVQLNANIDRQVEPDRLQISLEVRGCKEPILLVGTRLPRIQGLGVH